MRSRSTRVAVALLALAWIVWLTTCDLSPPQPDGGLAPRWDDLDLPNYPLVDGSAIAVDSLGLPTIALRHHQPLVGNRLAVLRLTAGDVWVELGDFAAADGLRRPAVTVDDSGNVVVAFVGSDDRVTVRRYVEPSWEDLGQPSSGAARKPSIALGASDTPMVGFVDEAAGDVLHVAAWAGGTSWTRLGNASPGAAESPSVATDSLGVPHVAFIDTANGSRARAAAWDSGTTWVDLGYLSVGTAYRTSAAIDSADRPVVLFEDWTTSVLARLVRWNGSDWNDLTVSGFPGHAVPRGDRNIAADSNGRLYLIAEFNDIDRCFERDSAGGWTGHAVLGSGNVFRTAIAVGSDGKPIVSFIDDEDGVLYVKKLQ